MIDELFGGEQRHAVFAIEPLVVHEVELQPEARLGQKGLANLIATVSDDDDRLADPLALQRSKHAHQQWDPGDGLQRLGERLLGYQPRPRASREMIALSNRRSVRSIILRPFSTQPPVGVGTHVTRAYVMRQFLFKLVNLRDFNCRS